MEEGKPLQENNPEKKTIPNTIGENQQPEVISSSTKNVLPTPFCSNILKQLNKTNMKSVIKK